MKEYVLRDDAEWYEYLAIFRTYLTEVCDKDDHLVDLIIDAGGDEHREELLRVTERTQNRFHIFRITEAGATVGFSDCVCYADEGGKCLIGNFYLSPEYRAAGRGGEVFDRMVALLRDEGGRYLDVTPSVRARSFYIRRGFIETTDKSLENGETVWRLPLVPGGAPTAV